MRLSMPARSLSVRSLALLILSAGCAATGLPDGPRVKEYALPQMDFQLGSGLRVLVQEDHNSPTVVVASVYQVGGASDPKGVEGLAHFVEHLAFKSRFGGGTQQLWDILKRTGAAFNATTAADLTTYYQIAHKDRLADLMQLEVWRLTNTLAGVTEAEFETEREVVRNELRQRRETSIGNRTFDELLMRLFPASHPLGHPMAGTHESLLNAKLSDAQKFVEKFYRPENCTIVIAGDVTGEQVKKLLGKWPAQALFGPDGQGGAKVPHKLLSDTPAPEPPAPASTALARLHGPVANPQLLIGWSAPGGLRGRDMLLQFAGTALNIALFTGLERKVEDDIIGASAGAIPLAEGSIILIQAELRKGADPEKARTRLLDTVVDAWSSDLGRAILADGKWASATGLLMASADPITSALAAAEDLATTGQPAHYKQRLSELAKVEPSAVQEFVHKYLKRERAVAVFFEPEVDDGGKGGGSLAGAGAKAGHDLGRADQVNISGMGPKEILQIARSPGLAALPRFKLPNGLEVITVQRKAAPLAQIFLQIPGGDATVSPYGLASLASDYSTSKCRDYGSLTPVGGSLGRSDGDLASRFTVRVLSGNIANGLAVLSDRVSCLEADEEEFQNLEERFKEMAERQRDRNKLPQTQAQKKLWATLYPNHPFGIQEAEVETLKRIKFADADAYVRAHYRPGNATAVVVADASATELRPLMERYFGRWSGAGGTPPQAPPPPTTPIARAIHLFDRPGATQSTLSIGCRLERLTPEKLPVFDILEAVATEKVWELRESWGATYGLSAGVQDFPGGTAHFLLQGAVETSRTGAAVEKLLSIIDTMATQGPDIKTFTLKRWDLAREFDRDFTATNAIAGAVLRTTQNGWPLDTFDQYPARLADTTRTDVRDVFAPCAQHEVVTIVGDAKLVRAQLEKQKLASLLTP